MFAMSLKSGFIKAHLLTFVFISLFSFLFGSIQFNIFFLYGLRHAASGALEIEAISLVV